MRAGRPKKETFEDTFKDDTIHQATFSIPFDRTDATTLVVDLTTTHARVWNKDQLLYDIKFFRPIIADKSEYDQKSPKISFKLVKETPYYWRKLGDVDTPPGFIPPTGVIPPSQRPIANPPHLTATSNPPHLTATANPQYLTATANLQYLTATANPPHLTDTANPPHVLD